MTIDIPEENPFDYDQWKENIHRVYSVENNSTAAEGIIELQNKLGWIYENKLPIYREKWAEIRNVLADSPMPEQILEMLDSVGLCIDEFEKTYSKEKISDALHYAKDLKDRYTVLWMYEQVK